MITYTIQIVLQGIAAFLIGTVVFDLFHFLFHTLIESKYKWLKAIGSLHLIHHRFYTSNLKIHPEWMNKNLIYHVSIEYMITMGGIFTCLLFLQPLAVLIAAVFETIIIVNVCVSRGVDVRHQSHDKLPPVRGGILVNASYHALHHMHPNKYFSSYIKILDYILGTSHYFKGKHITMTGANGALGSQLKVLLEKAGAKVTGVKYGKDYTYDNYEKLKTPLTSTDILVLCHGSKYENAQQANCDSYVRIIELYKSVRKREMVPLEIWATGSEIECHPCFGIKKIKIYAASKRNYAYHARQYFHDPELDYRHLVHSSFISRMGPGLMTASFAAKVTLFFIKRGFKYVPVTYTGFAFLNYLRFVLNK